MRERDSKGVDAEAGTAIARAKTGWLDAMRWRRRVSRILRGSGLTFPQWLMLEGAQQLIDECGDAVNQNEVAARIELDRVTISQMMCALDERGLVSRGPDLTGRAWRVYVCKEATELLAFLRPQIEAVSGPDCDAAIHQRNTLRAQRGNREQPLPPADDDESRMPRPREEWRADRAGRQRTR